MENISKKKLAYDFIKNQINDGSYGPGYRLIISDISKQLGISTIPVREAISQLENGGLVEVKHNLGAFVSSINRNEYIQIMTVLSVLEGFATSVIVDKITEEKIDELEKLNSLMENALAEWDFDSFSKCNREFHTIIVEESENPFLIEDIKRAWKQLDRVRQHFSVPKRAPESMKEHKEIIALLRSRTDRHVVEEFARRHKQNTINAFIQQEKNN